jgi:hypothetical protein
MNMNRRHFLASAGATPLCLCCASALAAPPRPFCGFTARGATGGIVPRSYTLKDAGGGKSRRTWTFSGAVKGVAAAAAVIQNAFGQWQAASPALQFTRVPRGADITISVGAVGAGVGGTVLAQTSADGRSITISDSATFVPQSLAAANPSFLGVMTHEIGHALGLLHATTDSSVMYPFAVQERLGPDDRDAIRALYGWSPQRKLQGGTEDTPAICACGNTLAMAWRGAGGDHNIWFATSTDGVNWTPQRKLPGAASVAGPALAWDGRALWMVWRGTGNDKGIYWANTTDFFGRNGTAVRKIGGVGSSHGPRIAIVGGSPMAVWKGVNSDHGIYFSRFDRDWAPQRKVGGVGTSASPAISPDVRGLARLLWRGIGNDHVLWTSRLTDPFWQPQQQVKWIIPGNGASGTVDTGTPGSASGPGLAFTAGKVIALWRGVPGDKGLYFTQFTNDSVGGTVVGQWSSQAKIPGVGSSHGPSLTPFGGHLRAVWKGVESDRGIYTATL